MIDKNQDLKDTKREDEEDDVEGHSLIFGASDPGYGASDPGYGASDPGYGASDPGN